MEATRHCSDDARLAPDLGVNQQYRITGLSGSKLMVDR